MKILIVDDDPDILQSLETFLSVRGHEITIEDDPYEALDAVQETPFHLVFLDINIPRRSGLRLLKEMKDRDRSLDIVMMTGYNAVEKVVDARKYGALDYLLKPFDEDFTDLERVVESAEQRMENWNQALQEEGEFEGQVDIVESVFDNAEPSEEEQSDEVT
ncbi:MAG: response regulator [bacterium]